MQVGATECCLFTGERWGVDMTDNTDPFVEIFNDTTRASRYAEGPAKFMPGFGDVHRMTNILIQERAPTNAKVLVHGAGGGLELEAFATANPDWSFLGVDPAEAMLDAARDRLGSLMERIDLHHGYIDDAPEGPFDGATSLLTLHFLEASERRRTIAEIVRRLKPGAPFVMVHTSFPQTADARSLWLDRYAQFAVASGVERDVAENARKMASEMSPSYDPETDEKLMRNAGLQNISMFFAAFTWRGWVGYA